MTRGVVAVALLFVLLVSSFAGSVAAAPASGIDCQCGKTGDYVLPKPLAETEPADGLSSTSPGGDYLVTTTPAADGAAFVTVKRKGSSVALIDQQVGTSWGFSPDDDRFVLYAYESGLLYAYLYNLAGPHPGDPIMPRVDVSRAGLIAFSPHGRYAVAMSIASAAPTALDLRVVDAETGTLLHDNTLAIYAGDVLTHELPMAQVEVEVIRVGFAPDGDDRSFAYAWIDGGTSQLRWALVKLDASPPQIKDDTSNYGFDWAFSPCGDRFAIVSHDGSTNLKETRLYSTLNQAEVGLRTDPITDDLFLTTDATSHVVHHGLSGADAIAPNTASASCSGGTPTGPTASFSVSTPRAPATPIAFTDLSTTPQGSITSRKWAFGDGGTSSVASPTHTYSSPGSYVVTLTVTTSYGASDTVTRTLVLSPPAGGPIPGVDCECGGEGDYVLPQPLVETNPANGISNVSPGGKYEVTTSSVSPGVARVTVKRKNSATPLVNQVEGSSWGFSPDDDRFVLYAYESGVLYAYLYNLDGATPGAPITPRVDVSRAGLIAFSPNGRYAVAMSIGTASSTELLLRVVDAESGATLHDNALAIYAGDVLTHELPMAQVEVEVIRVGFGPDGDDRSFAYAWIDGGTSQLRWALVKLDQSPAKVHDETTNYGFDWGFSPCGDRFAIVTHNGNTNLKETRLYSTLNHADVGLRTDPITDDIFLTTDAASHVVHHGLNGADPLATNVADDACPGGGGGGGGAAVSPVAKFSGGAQQPWGVPVAFTDASTTASGTITSRKWTFGDGGYSSETNPTHAYGAAGSYTVRLTVTNSFGRTSSTQKTVVVDPNNPPVVSFTFAPTAPSARDVVTFTSTSTDDDTIAQTYWTVNGVSFSGSVVQTIVCAPATTVVLSVTDSVGQSAYTSLDIPVGGTDHVAVPPGTDLDAAEDAACPGDTLVLGAGTYPGGATIGHVNIEGAGPGVSIIDGAGADGWVLTIAPDGHGPATLSVSSLTVSGGAAVYDTFGRMGGGGISVVAGGTTVFDAIESVNNQGLAGLYAYNNTNPISVSHSTFHHNAGIGAEFNVAVGVVSDSTFFENGIGMWADEGGASVERSVFHHNSGAGLVLNDADGWVGSSLFYGNGSTALAAEQSFVDVANTLVAENHGDGIEADGWARILDTTISANCGVGLKSEGARLYNSIVFGNATDLAGNLAEDVANLVSVDPLFVGDGDYHLTSGSPAVDQGDESRLPSELTLDPDGDDRVLATHGTALLDIGWDEWRDGQPALVVPTLGCGPVSGGSGGSGGTGGSSGTSASGGTGAVSTAGAAGDDAGTTSAGGTSHGPAGSAGEGGDAAVAAGGDGDTAGGGGTSGDGPGGAAAGSGEANEAGAGGEASPSKSPAKSDSGCSCRAAGDERGSGHACVLSLLVLGLAFRRRRLAARALQFRA